MFCVIFRSGCTGGRWAADGGASVSRRTGRKEKPQQDNGKVPEMCAAYRNVPAVASGKRLKAHTARIVPNHSAFRKRNDSRVTLSSSKNAVSFSSA